jgi:hypothetical protein
MPLPGRELDEGDDAGEIRKDLTERQKQGELHLGVLVANLDVSQYQFNFHVP